MELLSPCGSKEALVAAVQNGCNAVYLAGKQFGARAFAPNFSVEEMKEAITYAHLHDVSVYVTVNTLIFESELTDLLAYLDFLYLNQVDAIIVQDFGVANIVRKHYPDLALHASTQMHIHNKEGVQLLKEAGFQRVVAARETPVEALKEMVAVGLEIEVFVHGALCVCYSGQCNMSRVIGDRSGNRGSCAQPCRLPYRLKREQKWVETEGNHLLSPKDLCVDSDIAILKEIGVHALKIEGRMKKPEYVAHITAFYRYLLNQSEQDKKVISSYKENSQYLFSRGYTKGYLQQNTIEMSKLQPNHQGVKLGTVVKQTENNTMILLEDDLSIGDGIRFVANEDGCIVQKIYLNNREVTEAKKGETVSIYYAKKIALESTVLKTLNASLEKEIKINYQDESRKNKIELSFEGFVGQQALLTVYCGHYVASILSEGTLEPAINKATDKKRIEEQLTKVGNTVYEVSAFEYIGDENLFIPIATLNQMRREVLEALDAQRLCRYPMRAKAREETIDYPIETAIEIPYLIEVETEEQYKTCKEFGLEHVIFSSQTSDIVSNPLVNEKSEYKKSSKLFVQEVGGLLESAELKIAGTSMNITNSESISFLAKYGCHAFVLSNELSKKEKENLCETIYKKRQDIRLFEQVYGYQTMMISKHCVIRDTYNTEKVNCKLCHTNDFYLVDRKQEHYRLIGDENCNMQIFTSKPIWNTNIHDALYPYIRFTFEDKNEVSRILSNFKNSIRKGT